MKKILPQLHGRCQTGKAWSDRRRIIQSNLMSTMKGEFVDTATKRFISTKLFPMIDQDIADGKPTEFKLFRPIAFNMVLQACYGKELDSLDKGLWAEWYKLDSERNNKVMFQFPIALMLGSESKISIAIQTMLTGSDIVSDFKKAVDFVETLENAKNVDAEKDGNVRLFSDFIDDYVKMGNGAFTKRHLQGDMMNMFVAGIDTTHSVLAFALLEAAKDPALQQVLHEELVTAFGHDIEGIKLRGELHKIPRLRAFIQLRYSLYFVCRHLNTYIHTISPLRFQRGFEDPSSWIHHGT